MAKADDTTSTTDWIWLRDALALAFAARAVELAKERLIEWLAAGKLPWSCTSWKSEDAESIAKAEPLLREGYIIHILPSAVYYEGDPKFWDVRRVRLQIDWEQNTALEPVTGGAKAQGIKVSRTDLLALLPEEPREREEALRQTKPAERKLKEPKAWLAEVLEEHPQHRNESKATYARRIHPMMQAAPLTRQWPLETLLRRLFKG